MWTCPPPPAWRRSPPRRLPGVEGSLTWGATLGTNLPRALWIQRPRSCGGCGGRVRPMNGDEDWDDPRLFLVEQTQAIRRELATLVIPVLLVAAAIGFLGLSSKTKPQPQLVMDQG